MIDDDKFSWEDPNDMPFEPADLCRGCGGVLESENRRIADCCPCNSPRGINHGLVPKNTCTCAECDPAQTGSTRISAGCADAPPRDSRHKAFTTDALEICIGAADVPETLREAAREELAALTRACQPTKGSP